MKTHILRTLVLACTIVGIFFGVAAASSAVQGDIHVGLVNGDVLINTEDTQDWVPAAANMPLAESDRLWVAEEGRSELRLRRGTVVRLNSRTALEVVAVETERLQVALDSGQAYVHSEGLSSDTIVISTPAVTVLPEQEATFRIDVDEGGDTSVSVLYGAVRVEHPSRALRLTAGAQTTFKKGFHEPQFTSLRPPDGWEEWNRARDREQFGPGPSVSRRYLPQELTGYARVFDTNGRWVKTPQYGFVWTPTVVVMSSWAPYRMGRWVWMRGHYVWLSHEDWGWAPHHYGRWAFVPSLGWCWVPPARRQVHWGPGYVGWAHSPTAVSWVPLGPNDPYHGHDHRGPGNRHSAGYPDPSRTVERKHPYANARVTNAFTAVHRDTFLTGESRVLKGFGNPFLEKWTVSGPPDIKPVKATVIPVVREVPASRRPPARLFTGPPRKMENHGPPSPALPAKPATNPLDAPTSRDRSKISPNQSQTGESGKPARPLPVGQESSRPSKDGVSVKPPPPVVETKPGVSPEGQQKVPPKGPSQIPPPMALPNQGLDQAKAGASERVKNGTPSVEQKTGQGTRKPSSLDASKPAAPKPSTILAPTPAPAAPRPKRIGPPATEGSGKPGLQGVGKEGGETKGGEESLYRDGTKPKEGQEKERKQETRQPLDEEHRPR